MTGFGLGDVEQAAAVQGGVFLEYARRCRESIARGDGSRGPRQAASVEYRCSSDDGCLLLAAYVTRPGTLIYQPATRMSARHVGHGEGVLQTTDVRTGPRGQLHHGERAFLLMGAITVGCDHQYGDIEAAVVRADMAQAQETGSRVERVLATRVGRRG